MTSQSYTQSLVFGVALLYPKICHVYPLSCLKKFAQISWDMQILANMCTKCSDCSSLIRTFAKSFKDLLGSLKDAMQQANVMFSSGILYTTVQQLVYIQLLGERFANVLRNPHLGEKEGHAFRYTCRFQLSNLHQQKFYKCKFCSVKESTLHHSIPFLV